jgi:hypothetical protein
MSEKGFTQTQNAMNSSRIPSDSAGEPDDAKAAIKEFFAAVAVAHNAQQKFGNAAPAALDRLVAAIYPHDNSQAVTAARCLASIYNGSCALGVRLDEIRWLDWSLQQDLITVMLGTGHAGFEDSDIRKAFERAGGEAAVEWLHWHTSGGPHKAALRSLITFIKENRHSSTGKALLSIFRSLQSRSVGAQLSALNYMGEYENGRDISHDVILVMGGLFGRDQGCLHLEDIPDAFAAAGIAALLTADADPVSS